ncbi:unnamed protein product [Calypogeia fissa]
MEMLCCSLQSIIDKVAQLLVDAVTNPLPRSPTPENVPPEEAFIHVRHPHEHTDVPYVDLCDDPTLYDFHSLPPTPASPSLRLEEYQRSTSPENAGTLLMAIDDDVMYSPSSGLGSLFGVVPPVETDETLEPVTVPVLPPHSMCHQSRTLFMFLTLMYRMLLDLWTYVLVLHWVALILTLLLRPDGLFV